MPKNTPPEPAVLAEEVTLYLHPETAAALDRLCHRRQTGRSDLVAQLVLAEDAIPDADQAAEVGRRVGQMLSIINESMESVYAATDGVRAQMRGRGYSDQAAEHAAMQYLSLAQQNLWMGTNG